MGQEAGENWCHFRDWQVRLCPQRLPTLDAATASSVGIGQPDCEDIAGASHKGVQNSHRDMRDRKDMLLFGRD